MTNIIMKQEAISMQERHALHQKTQWGDIERAAQIYQEQFGKKIAPNYLTKFLTGYREGSAKIARKHQPLDMYAAIVAAIAERQAKTLETNQKAAQLRRLIEMNNRPPDHRYPPLLSILALSLFCWGGLWLLVTILDTFYHSQS